MSLHRRPSGWLRRALAMLLGAAALVLLVPAGPAAAHASLLSTSPASGSVLRTSVSTVVLTYDEPVRTVADGFQLYDRSGSRRALVANGIDSTVTVQLPPDLGDGSYVVSWRVVSVDSHPVTGALTFAVGHADGTAPRVAPSDSTAVSITYEALHTLGYLALLTLVGLTVFEIVVLRGIPSDGRQRQRAKRLAAGAATVAYTVLVPLSRVREEGGGLARLLSRSALSGGWVSAAGGAALLVVIGSGLVLASSQATGRLFRTVIAIAGAAVVMGSVLPVGHTRTYAPAWLILSTDLVHATTAAVWCGGLLGLGLFLTKRNRSVSQPGHAAVVLSRFSALAGGLVALLAATGLVLAVVIVGSVRGLVDSSYGQLLLVKLGLVGIVVGLAAWNRFHLLPLLRQPAADPVRWRQLSRALVIEATVLVLVVCVTGALVMQSPTSTEPDGGVPVSVGQDSASSTALATDLGTGHFTGTLTPGRVGDNYVDFELTDASGQPLTPVAPPEVKVSDPQQGIGSLTATVQPSAIPGSYRAVVNLPVAGTWQITAAVRVTEFEQPLAIVNITIGP